MKIVNYVISATITDKNVYKSAHKTLYYRKIFMNAYL